MRHRWLIGKRGSDHQIATRGHDLEHRSTEELLVVESPPTMPSAASGGADLVGVAQFNALPFHELHQPFAVAADIALHFG